MLSYLSAIPAALHAAASLTQQATFLQVTLALYILAEVVGYVYFHARVRGFFAAAPAKRHRVDERYRNDILRMLFEECDPEDTKNFFRYAFYGLEIEEITRQSMLDWIEAHLQRGVPENEAVDRLEKLFKRKFADGPSQIDTHYNWRYGEAQTHACYRPIALYCIVMLVRLVTFLTLSSMGFTTVPVSKECPYPMHYYVYTPPVEVMAATVPERAPNSTPLLFVHGFGFGVTPYLPLVLMMRLATFVNNGGEQRYPITCRLLRPLLNWSKHIAAKRYATVLPGDVQAIGSRPMVLVVWQWLGLRPWGTHPNRLPTMLSDQCKELHKFLSAYCLDIKKRVSDYETQKKIEEETARAHAQELLADVPAVALLAEAACAVSVSPCPAAPSVSRCGLPPAHPSSTPLTDQMAALRTQLRARRGVPPLAVGTVARQPSVGNVGVAGGVRSYSISSVSTHTMGGASGSSSTVGRLDTLASLVSPRDTVVSGSVGGNVGGSVVFSEAADDGSASCNGSDLDSLPSASVEALPSLHTHTHTHTPTDTPAFQVDVIGHSYGTSVTSAMHKLFPTLFRRVVLVDPICFIPQLTRKSQLVHQQPFEVTLFDRVTPKASDHCLSADDHVEGDNLLGLDELPDEPKVPHAELETPCVTEPAVRDFGVVHNTLWQKLGDTCGLMTYWYFAFRDPGTAWTTSRQLAGHEYIDRGELTRGLKDRLLVVLAEHDLLVPAGATFRYLRRVAPEVQVQLVRSGHHGVPLHLPAVHRRLVRFLAQ